MNIKRWDRADNFGIRRVRAALIGAAVVELVGCGGTGLKLGDGGTVATGGAGGWANGRGRPCISARSRT